jgi:hypothetical protein
VSLAGSQACAALGSGTSRSRSVLRSAGTTFLLAILPALSLPTSAGAQVCPEFEPAVSGGTVEEALLLEASGMSASRWMQGVLWVHNDSGASATLFAMGTDGTAIATANLVGATNVDWEDLALGPGPDPEVDYLYVGDIGDNSAARSSITIYRVPEPHLETQLGEGGVELIDVAGVVALDVSYPDGARDAETLLADPVTGDLYIVSKDLGGASRVYRHAFPQAEDQVVVLEAVMDLPFEGGLFERAATAGDISAAGDEIAIRTYFKNFLWLREPGQSIASALAGERCEIALAIEPQGETLAFAADGGSYFTVSENAAQPVYEYVRSVPEPGAGLREATLVLLFGLARCRAIRAWAARS